MDKIIALALREDIGQADITTNLLVGKKARCTAHILTREPCVVAGLAIAQKVFKKLDRRVAFKIFHKDGEKVGTNTALVSITGKTRAILTGERVALNFLSRLSAIATKTHHFVQKVKPYKVEIYDTRKTTPTLRLIEKIAVRCGGGVNHRLSLHEMVLIKDNHHLVIREGVSMKDVIRRIRRKTQKPIAVEVDNLNDYRKVLEGWPDFILLDNMSIRQIKKAVATLKAARRKKKPKLEVSGRVNLRNVATIARLGVDRISIGALTHSIRSIDMTLELKGGEA